MNERFKEIRKSFKLSQEEFGKRLGVGKSSISLLESGRNNLTDSMMKLICREFNVDYLWLTTGEGEMFSDSDDDLLGRIDDILTGENIFHRNLIKTCANFDQYELDALESMIDKYIEIKKAGN